MYAEQAAQRNGNIIGAGAQYPDAAMAKQVIEKARLQQQLDQLAKVLSECHHHTQSLENGVDRIIGPVPQTSDKAPAPVSPTTLEQKLAIAIGFAEELMGKLAQTSKRLNSAV